MIRRPPRSTPLYSSAASDVYKRQISTLVDFIHSSYGVPAASVVVRILRSSSLAARTTGSTARSVPTAGRSKIPRTSPLRVPAGPFAAIALTNATAHATSSPTSNFVFHSFSHFRLDPFRRCSRVCRRRSSSTPEEHGMPTGSHGPSRLSKPPIRSSPLLVSVRAMQRWGFLFASMLPGAFARKGAFQRPYGWSHSGRTFEYPARPFVREISRARRDDIFSCLLYTSDAADE